jgi:DNA helicase-2/ATP-dependent DNA helicase PcrA
LWTDSGQGERIVGYVADNEHDEAAFVAGEIDALADSGEAIYSDVAVFYRTNNQSRVFEEIFIRLGLPYRVVGGVRFYERREVRDALAYLRVLANPDDTVSLRRILNVPKRGIGDRAEAAVAGHAERERMSFAAALREAAAGRIPQLNPRSQKAIAAFVELLDGVYDLVDSGEQVAEVLDAVLSRTGYRAILEESDDPQDASRLENHDELVTVAREFTESAQAASAGEEADADEDADVPEPGSLPAFLERVSLVADADSIPAPDGEGGQEAGVVTLMTVHTAKGLEYPVVFGTGWEDGVFPHLRALGEPRELAEERRLAYVAITRAKRRLYLSRTLLRTAWGQPMNNPASRFLDEIPAELIDWRREDPSGDQDSGAPRATTTWRRRAGVGSDSAQASLAERGMRTTSFRGWKDRRSDGWKDTVAIKLEIGDRVNHDKYGLGTVVATEGTGPRATATIDFGAAGTVRLMLIGSVPMVKL